MAHQSLYRRYRSQKFSEFVGQSHVTEALQTAVKEGRYGHAYLFSGPRGTGKTSTARVLAKALNCENLTDGEPCTTCESCLAIEHGTSFDLHELDAASNNKVDDIRDLIAKVALGSPGRTKVYILDEVHMLSAGAENALLKTLEEPPDHVVFVLATTEPHKVVETIRSRTQAFEFRLISRDALEQHVRFVIADAGLDVDDAGVDYVLRRGGGSARDTLSALDLVAATGGIPEDSDVGYELAAAIGAGDAGATITIVQRALEAGREPRIIGEMTLDVLRNAFLASMVAPITQLSDTRREQATTLAGDLGPATITRSLETLGQALVEMRQAPDPRVPLEVALLRLARRDGSDHAALLQRIEALEAAVAGGQVATPPAAPATAAPAPSNEGQPAPAPSPPARRAPAPPRPRPAAEAAPDASPAPDEPAAAEPAAAPAATGSLSLSSLQNDYAEILADVTQKVRSKFRLGTIIGLEGDVIVFGLPNAFGLERCEAVKEEMEQALSDRFGHAVTIDLRLDSGGAAPAGPAASTAPAATAPAEPPKPDDVHDDVGDVSQLDNADIASSGIDRLTEAFPGAEVVEPVD